MMKFGVAVAAAAATLALAGPANAGVLEHFQIKVGVSDIIPNEHGSPIQASISDAVVPTLGIEYFFNDHVSAELLCCAATHDVTAANGAVDLGTVTHSPPTLTLKYRWNTEGQFQPYVGAGVGFANVSANNIQTLNTTVMDDSDLVFAYQAIGGISYLVMPKTTMFLEYRYFATVDPKFDAAGGGTIKSQFQSNNIMIGARYAF